MYNELLDKLPSSITVEKAYIFSPKLSFEENLKKKSEHDSKRKNFITSFATEDLTLEIDALISGKDFYIGTIGLKKIYIGMYTQDELVFTVEEIIKDIPKNRDIYYNNTEKIEWLGKVWDDWGVGRFVFRDLEEEISRYIFQGYSKDTLKNELRKILEDMAMKYIKSYYDLQKRLSE